MIGGLTGQKGLLWRSSHIEQQLMAFRSWHHVDYVMLVGSIQFVDYILLAGSVQTADCSFDDGLTRAVLIWSSSE